MTNTEIICFSKVNFMKQNCIRFRIGFKCIGTCPLLNKPGKDKSYECVFLAFFTKHIYDYLWKEFLFLQISFLLSKWKIQITQKKISLPVATEILLGRSSFLIYARECKNNVFIFLLNKKLSFVWKQNFCNFHSRGFGVVCHFYLMIMSFMSLVDCLFLMNV